MTPRNDPAADPVFLPRSAATAAKVRNAEEALERVEREKYETMWADDRYRRWSPGLDELEASIEALLPFPGASFEDFGAGPAGLVVDELLGLGFDARGFDLVAGENPRVEKANLWRLPLERSTDYVVSFDVLEHIPTTKVPDVLSAIRARARYGAAFSVATTKDAMGALHGLTLHETVRPPEWWDEMVAEYVPGSVERLETDRSWAFLYVVHL